MIKGVGVGLRQPHYQQFIQHQPDIPWVELLVDNYLYTQGVLKQKLLTIRQHYPMTFHGVGMNLGSADPLDQAYLKQLQRLMAELQPAWVSEHLSWTGFGGDYRHDLLPLPFTDESFEHVCAKIDQVQSSLKQPILIENVSTYVSFKGDTFSEVDFINAITQKTGCGVLLDINNIYVNSCNHDFDPYQYLSSINHETVKQMHLGGHQDREGIIIDTHDSPVAEPVWRLYQQALKQFGPVPTCIEWDFNVPEWPVLLAQQQQACELWQEAFDYEVG